MTNVFHHVKRHAKNLGTHLKKHHKKYLLGIFGGYAVVKLFLLVVWFSVMQYVNTSTFANSETGCVLTGQYYTGEYQTWGYLAWQKLTWWYLADCSTIPGYRTGGDLDDSWNLIWQTWIDDIQTWCVITGQTLSEGYWTWYETTWGYRTGWTLLCNEETWTNETWTLQQQNDSIWWNGICESWDIMWSMPLSWSVVRDIFSVVWSYSWTDCISSGLSLQLRDHNGQRINLGTVASWTTSYAFDSKALYASQYSWFYSIFWTGESWQMPLYTGTYTWIYSRLFTWYKIRLLSSQQTTLYETPSFTIDNESPTLTWISLLSSWSATWYLTTSGIVTLTFTASEALSWVHVTLWSGRAATSSIISWLLYTYTRNLSSLYPQGTFVAAISFADGAGNTGAVLYTWWLVFDTTRPVVTWFIFSEYTGWLFMNFTWSETVNYTLIYQKTGWLILTSSNADYLTAQQVSFSGLERDQIYTFNLHVFDRAGNIRIVTGDVVRTNLGAIVSHIYIVPGADEAVLSWSLATLANVLKAEVEKFNVCKDTLVYTPVELVVKNTSFIIQMPNFKKSEVKTLVNAFTLFLLDKVKHSYTITSDEIHEITKKFDNFLIVLKLLRDDDNNCEQNLSTYHISQFKQALEEYHISLTN